MRSSSLLLLAALAFALCFAVCSYRAFAEEPSDNSGAIPAPPPPAEKPAAKIINIYIKGEDFVKGIEDKAVDLKASLMIMLGMFELAQDTKAVRKKYDKIRGYDLLRKEAGFDFTLENVVLFWNGKSKKAAEGATEKEKYTDEEMAKVADYIVETTSATEYDEISWMDKLTHYKYTVTATVKVTEAGTGKVIFTESNTSDNTSNVKLGKEKAARIAIEYAVKPLAMKVLRLDAFKDHRKAAAVSETPEAPKVEPPKTPVTPKEDPKKETPEPKNDKGAEQPKEPVKKPVSAE